MNKSTIRDNARHALRDAGIPLTVEQMRTTLDELIDQIEQGLVDDERVEVRGFGTFVLQVLDAREVRNPQNNEIVMADPTVRVRFRPSSKLIERLSPKVHGE